MVPGGGAGPRIDEQEEASVASRVRRLATPAKRLTATVTALGAVLLPITVLGGDAHILLPLLTANSGVSRPAPPTDTPHVGAGGQLPTDPPLASLTVLTSPVAWGAGTGPFARVPAGQLEIPQIALTAYLDAAQIMADTHPQCGLHWSILAGIGRIESNHAAGGSVNAAGTTLSPILGPELNGSPGTAAIPDTEHGALDGDAAWDRAVGPMQFIPTAWRRYAPGPNANPNNVHDAALATADFLCADGVNLPDPVQLATAIYRYDPSYAFVRAVLEWAGRYATGVVPLPPGLPATDVAPPGLVATALPVGGPAPGQPPPLPSEVLAAAPPPPPTRATAPLPTPPGGSRVPPPPPSFTEPPSSPPRLSPKPSQPPSSTEPPPDSSQPPPSSSEPPPTTVGTDPTGTDPAGS